MCKGFGVSRQGEEEELAKGQQEHCTEMERGLWERPGKKNIAEVSKWQFE